MTPSKSTSNTLEIGAHLQLKANRHLRLCRAPLQMNRCRRVLVPFQLRIRFWVIHYRMKVRNRLDFIVTKRYAY